MEAKPPSLAPRVSREQFLAPLVAALVGWVAWNFLIAPHVTGVGGIDIFAAFGLAFAAHWALVAAGYAAGEGLARHQLAQQEQYAHQAAAYLSEVEEEIEEAEDELARHVGGGQG